MAQEEKVLCPKCGSDDVLVGTNALPNKCSDCGHKWETGEKVAKVSECTTTAGIADFMGALPVSSPKKKRKKFKMMEDIRIVEPEVITINQTPFERKLDYALSRFLSEAENEKEDDKKEATKSDVAARPRISAAIDRSGKSQAEIARAMGKHPTWVSRAKRRKAHPSSRDPSIEALGEFGKATQTSPSDLIKDITKS